MRYSTYNNNVSLSQGIYQKAAAQSQPQQKIHILDLEALNKWLSGCVLIACLSVHQFA